MYEFKTRVGIDQSGEDGRQTVIGVLNTIQNCTQFWLEEQHRLKKCMEEKGFSIFIVSRQLEILRSAGYGDMVTARTSIYDCKAYFGYRNTVVFGEDGELCARSCAQVVFVDLKTGEPTRLGAEVLASIERFERFPMEYLPRRIALPQGGGKARAPIEISPFDIDFNHHVNNTRYVQMACEALGDFHKYNRFRTEYKRAAKLGERIFPQVFQSGSSGLVRLCDELGEDFCVVEFSCF